MSEADQVHEFFRQALGRVLLTTPQDPAQLAAAAGIGLDQLWGVAEGKLSLDLSPQTGLARAAGYQYDQFLALGRHMVEGAPEGAPGSGTGREGPAKDSVAGHLSRLLRVAGSFGVADSEEDLMGRITQSLCRYLPFQRAMLFLLRDRDLVLRSLHWEGGDPSSLERALGQEPPRLAPGSMEYESLALGRALPLEVEASEFFPPSVRPLLGGQREVALAPLFTDRQFIGVMAADFPEEPQHRVSEEDLALLETFALLVGSLLNNWWLYTELEEKNRQLQFKVHELMLVGELTRILNRARAPEAMARQMLGILTASLQADLGFLFLYEDKKQELRLFASQGLAPEVTAGWTSLCPVTPQMLAAAVEKGRDLAQGRLEGFTLLPGLGGPLLLRALSSRQQYIGLWGLGRQADDNPFQPQEQQLLATADEQVTVALNSLRLRLLATTDQLTGLYTRAHFNEALDQELKVAQYLGLPLSLIMVDADHFKKVNDTYGHPAGDAVLAALGRTLKSSSRGSDVSARLGGEEFVLLMPRTDQTQAMAMAEKLRRSIAEMPISHNDLTLRITVSLGVAVQEPGQTLSREAIVERADQALYQAKNTGRNRAQLWQPS